MKKLIAMACCALAFGFGAVAAETQYKVYDVTMSLKTTKMLVVTTPSNPTEGLNLFPHKRQTPWKSQ